MFIINENSTIHPTFQTDDTFQYSGLANNEKIRPDISCESQMIHMIFFFFFDLSFTALSRIHVFHLY